jgi:cation/acetate symporter
MTRLVNPRLGLLLGIYSATLIGVALVILLLEQMGIADGLIRALAFGLPLIMFVVIGVATGTRDSLDFHAAGRRIPAFFAGLATAVAALGGFGILILTGCLFIMGADAFPLLLGIPAGLVVMAVVLVPFLRKVGAHSVPGFLGQRLDSALVRIVSAAIVSLPLLLILVAEVHIAGRAGAALTGLSAGMASAVCLAAAGLIVATGGMRALTWSLSAKAIAVLLAVVIPATIVSLIVANLPFPQLTAGNIARNVLRAEQFRNTPILAVAPLVFEVPGDGWVALAKRFLQSHGHIGTLASSLTVLIVMAGIAGSPALLARTGTTPTVHAARSAMSWAVLFTGFILLTLVAIAVFLRGLVVDQVVGQAAERLPAWFMDLQQAGVMQLQSKTGEVRLNGLLVQRDLVFPALPIAIGLPRALSALMLAGAIAAALAAIAAHVQALGTILARDVVLGPEREAHDEGARVFVGRIAMVVITAAALAIAMLPADPLLLILWGLALTASAVFPVLVLAVLWKRLSPWGAVSGIVTGFTVTTLLILSERMGIGSLAGPLPAAIGMPAALVAAVSVSLVTRAVGRHTLEFVRDMRVPGGETLVDRDARILRLQHPSA